MVDEYLSEREQAEQLRAWLRQNGIWLLAGVALTASAATMATAGGNHAPGQRSIEAGEQHLPRCSTPSATASATRD